ncbi:MAG: DUF3015 domain-containing protein [Gammaproteobacteria bacterium]|nr:DUF3015 domain-containing protein [Gammaproteobacteria bacterium]
MKKYFKKMMWALLTGVYLTGGCGFCHGGNPITVSIALTSASVRLTSAPTKGTSDALKRIRRDAKTFNYVETNRDKLAREMAVGKGETLESLAHILEIHKSHKTRFFSIVREHFKTIFPHTDTDTQEVLASLKKVLNSDKVLAKYADTL